MSENECSGCSTENWCREYGFLDSKCPCCTCLVKPICTKACDGYDNLIQIGELINLDVKEWLHG